MIELYFKAPYPYLNSDLIYQLVDEMYDYGLQYTLLTLDETLENDASVKILNYVVEKEGKVIAKSQEAYESFIAEKSNLILEIPTSKSVLDELILDILASEKQTVLPAEVGVLKSELTILTDSQTESLSTHISFFSVGNDILFIGISLSLVLFGTLLIQSIQKKKS